MAPHNHLQQHHGRSNNHGHQRIQSSTSQAGGAKVPHKRNSVIEAASTHNAQAASSSTNRVGRWVQEQRGRVEDSVGASDAEQMRADSTSQSSLIQQGQRSSGSAMTAPQQQTNDPFSLGCFGTILRALEARGLCLTVTSPRPLNIATTLPTATTVSASFATGGGSVSASLPWQGGDIAASLPAGHSASATLPGLTSLEVKNASSCTFGGGQVGEQGQYHHHLLPANEEGYGYGYGLESTAQLKEIEEGTETGEPGWEGDGSTTVQ